MKETTEGMKTKNIYLFTFFPANLRCLGRHFDCRSVLEDNETFNGTVLFYTAYFKMENESNSVCLE